MCQPNDASSCTFEAIVSDPLIKLVMASDGVTADDLREVLQTARAALQARALDDQARLTQLGTYALIG